MPSEFTRSRSRSLLILVGSLAAIFLTWWIGIENEEGREIPLVDREQLRIVLIFVPVGIVLGVAGLFDPRLPWAIYPNIAEKLPRKTRIIGNTLFAASFVVGVAWFVWYQLA